MGSHRGSRLCMIAIDASSLAECYIITCKCRQSFLRNGFISLGQLTRWPALDNKNRRGNFAELLCLLSSTFKEPASIG